MRAKCCSNLLVTVNASTGLSVILRGGALACLTLRTDAALSFCWKTAEGDKLITNLISSSQHKMDLKIDPGSGPRPLALVLQVVSWKHSTVACCSRLCAGVDSTVAF